MRRNLCARPSWAQSCRDDGNSRKNVTFFDVSEAVVMSFCVALRGNPSCFKTPKKIVLCGRRNTFAICSKYDVLHFAWQAQHFGRVVLHVFANRIVSAAQSGDKVQIPWQAWHLVCYENRPMPRTKRRFCSRST